VFVLLAVLASGRTHAMQLLPAQKAEMKSHYEKATRAYDLGKYQEAVDEYQKAYEIGGDPPMLYNIGQAYRLNDQPAEAIRFYRRYLQRSPNARNREDVERKITDLEKLIDERRKAAAAVTPPPVSTTPPPVVTVTPPPVTPPPPPLVVPPSPEPPSRARQVVGWSMIGAGVIAGGVAIFEGLRAKQKGDQLTTDSNKDSHPVFDPSVESAGQTANLATIVLGISGTALAITGAVILMTGGSDAPPTQTARVSFTPWVSGGLFGGGARLQF
jgi:tetratricopeptide (TPR) repeat protein